MKILVSDGIHPKGEDILKNAGHEVIIEKYPQEELADKMRLWFARQLKYRKK